MTETDQRDLPPNPHDPHRPIAADAIQKRPKPPRFYSMHQVMVANANAGLYFFDADTLRFFRSRVSDILHGGRYFTTSERGPDGIRAYTVREAMPDGNIAKASEFQQYQTWSGANAAAQRLATQHA